MTLAKVDGYEGLAKDLQSGAIVNTDRRAFESARTAKNKLLQSKKKQSELEQRIANLEFLVNQLLETKDDRI